MHNSNFIDADQSLQQAKEFSDFGSSLRDLILKELKLDSVRYRMLSTMADCQSRQVTSLQFDIKVGMSCHFALESAKSNTLTGVA